MAIAVLSECAKKLLDLGFGQMLPDPINLVTPPTFRRTGRITLFSACVSCSTVADIAGLSEINWSHNKPESDQESVLDGRQALTLTLPVEPPSPRSQLRSFRINLPKHRTARAGALAGRPPDRSADLRSSPFDHFTMPAGGAGDSPNSPPAVTPFDENGGRQDIDGVGSEGVSDRFK